MLNQKNIGGGWEESVFICGCMFRILLFYCFFFRNKNIKLPKTTKKSTRDICINIQLSITFSNIKISIIVG